MAPNPRNEEEKKIEAPKLPELHQLKPPKFHQLKLPIETFKIAPEDIQKKIIEVKPIENELDEEKDVKNALKMESE